ncbi:MAG: tyrosine-type recombinase/integrase, partial [Lachnospirales bacterium]
LEPRTFKDYYHKILIGAGLKDKGITFHALRHTFATRCLERKMDVKTLSVILGHYSVAFTLDTYAHVLDDHKVKEMAKLNDLY